MKVIGGYRLVRKLGESDRAEVYLGHAGAGEREEPERSAAIKVYRPSTPLSSIDEEIEALARASSRHLVELRDLSSTKDGRPCLIFERHDADPLSRLFGQRIRIDAGEVVTALAPIALAVGELHRVGVAHGAVRLSSVLLDRHGAPILAAFGRARLVAAFPAENAASLTPAGFAAEPRVLADLHALVAMMDSVLELVRSGPSLAVDQFRSELAELDLSRDPHLLAARLADSLFALAPATPIAPRSSERAGSASARSGIPPRTGMVPTTNPTGTKPVAEDRVIAGISVPAWMLGGVHPRRAVLGAVTKFMALVAPVRRSFWIMGAIGIAAVVAAVVVVAPTASGSDALRPGSNTTGEGSNPANAKSARPAPGGSPTARASRPRSASAAPAASAGPGASVGPVAAADPLDAAKQLVIARGECIRRKSITCLDLVDQKDSAAMDQDRQLIRQTGSHAVDRLLSEGVLTLVQELGDSAIIAITPPEGVEQSSPASLLVVRSEAGWRIRDLVLP